MNTMAKLGTLHPWDSAVPVLSLGRPIIGVEIGPITGFSLPFQRALQANLSTRRFHNFLPRAGSRNWYWFATEGRRAKIHTCSAESGESLRSTKIVVTQMQAQNEPFHRKEVIPERVFKASACAPQHSPDEGSTSWNSRPWSLVAQGLGGEASKSDHAEQHLAIPQTRRDGNRTLQHFIRHVGFVVAAAMIGLFGHVNFRAPFSLPAHAATTEVLLKRSPGNVTAQKATFNQRAVYALDYFFATEPAGKAVILLAITAIMTAFGGGLYYKVAVAEDPDFDLPESVWTAWTFVADPGTHAGENTFRRRLVAVPLTMGGMLFFALLVGLMSDAVSSKVDQLQKGGSPVIEENHTLIVGWTPKTIPLVKELTEANKSRGPKRSIVVLGGFEKEAMDEELLQALPMADRHGSKVVTRKGRPTATEDLKLCSAAMARSIIVLSPHGLVPNDADAQVLQTCLVLAYLSDIQGDVIAELAQLASVKLTKDMLSTAITCTADRQGVRKPKLAASGSAVAGPAAADTIERFRKVVPVATDDIVLRMMVERALQPGTAAVAKELLLFEGSEFRFKAWPELVGKKFGEVMYVFEDAIPCGLRKKSAGGEPSSYTLVNPPPDTIIEEGDKILVISEDDDSYRPDASHEPPQSASFKAYQKQSKPVLKILITGFRHDLKDVLRHVDSSVAKGSEVTLLATEDMEVRNKELKQGSALQNVKLTHKFGDPQSRQVLEELPLETYDKTIILNNNNEESGGTTATALLVRHIQVQRGRKDTVIVAELAAAHDDALQRVQETWLIDSVVPEELQAMVLAHLAEDADVGAVLDEVVSDAGSNMLLHEVGTYADYGDLLDFWDLQARALQNGEIVIAFKCAANGGDWVLNPSNKSDKLVWNQGDEVLVLTRPS